MFAQVATKTVYSFMDSLVDLKTYLKKAKELGYTYLGIMDKDNLYGAYHFIKAAKDQGFRPIIGLEVDLLVEGELVSFCFIAKDTQGYQNLLKLSTAKMTDKENFADVEEYLSGLLIVVPYFEGIPQLNLPHPFYVGVSLDTPQMAFEQKTFPLHSVRYFSNEDTETLQVLHAIQENLPLGSVSAPEKNQLLYPEKEIEKLFQERFPESLRYMEEELSAVDYHFNQELKLPRFNREQDAALELRNLAESGLRDKGLWEAVYQDRLNQELAVIHKMGFDDYFLIVWDLLRFGRSQGYYMGMGRGSAAGSLVAFALDITGIDPVKNNLLFERFLNLERYSMPDIDIDLPDIYRSQFLKYVRDRYGSTHSAQIVTFSTFGARQAIRDVFKRFGATEYELGNLTKKIGFKDDLTSVYEKNMAFRQIINSRPEFQRAFAISKRIEGNPRQTSIHAAGIVMSDDNLTDHIPLKAGEDMMVTQYDAAAVEANGLLKMDFLGLRNLTFIQKMKEKVDKASGLTIDIKSIDLEDAKTLELFAAGNTKGIFQFEAAGAINLLRRIKPARFEEVVATTSLNRPGASDYTENFIKRKYGQEEIDLIDPVIAPILEPTYGIMLYQEQVMQIAQIYAGFTLGRADMLRRAMSKKDTLEMQKMEEEFLVGAQKLGRKAETARKIFGRMAKFAGYGFNKSHAYAYSALAFQMAYFKAHYPDIFFDIMLNYSNAAYVNDALEREFHIAQVSLNNVPYTDKVADGSIFLGLKNIKGFPREFAYWILEHRPFESIEDFLTQVPERYQKPEFLEPLIKIGLFDVFDHNRQKILKNLPNLLIFVNELGSLFADSSYHWTETEDFSNAEKYQLETDILGVGISQHPLLEMAATSPYPIQPIAELVKDTEGFVLAQIESSRIIRTKSTGEQMAFLRVTDTKNKLDITLFPETFQHYKHDLIEGQMAYFKGKMQERDGRLQMVLREMMPVSAEKFWLQIPNHEKDREISDILSQFPGHIPVVLHYQESKETLQSSRFFVSKSAELQEKLKAYTMKTIFR